MCAHEKSQWGNKRIENWCDLRLPNWPIAGPRNEPHLLSPRPVILQCTLYLYMACPGFGEVIVMDKNQNPALRSKSPHLLHQITTMEVDRYFSMWSLVDELGGLLSKSCTKMTYKWKNNPIYYTTSEWFISTAEAVNLQQDAYPPQALLCLFTCLEVNLEVYQWGCSGIDLSGCS